MFKNWNWFERILLLVNVAFGVYFLVSGAVYDWLALLGLVASISNTLCVILTAKKKVINFAWGVLGTLSYGIVAFMFANTGEWMLNLLYYLPTNIIAWIAWYKHSEDKINVRARAMTWKQILVTLAVSIVGIALYAWFLCQPSVQIFLYHSVTGFTYWKYLIDSFGVIGSIVGMILLIKQFREQWLVWIAVDVMTIILWCFTFNPTMILMWATMLANATYGYIKWLEKEKIDVQSRSIPGKVPAAA